ncbi:two-component regulator propeller domain-containing protein [Fibrobacterota bacterium]
MPYKRIVFYLLIVFSLVDSQPPEWMAFCGGTSVYGFLCKEDTVWIHTKGGIAKLNTVTAKMEFYNTGNSELKSNSVRALALDSTGSLWAGTNWGISRYNGLNWTTYTKENSNIGPCYKNSLAVDKDNNVWAGSWGFSTISIFNGMVWEYYNAIDPGAPQNSINSIITDWRGKTLVGASWGILYADKDTSITDTTQGEFSVRDMVLDSIGNVWIATERNGVYYFDGVSKTAYDSTNSVFPSNFIYGLCYNSRKVLYAITAKQLYMFTNSVWEVCDSFNISIPDGEGWNRLDADNKGNLWLGTFNSYCFKWDGKQAKQYCPFNFPHRLCPWSIGIDSKGRCWAGNWASPGLKDTMIYFDGKQWHKLGLQDAYTALDTLSFKQICDMDTLKIWVDSNCALVYRKYSWTGTYPPYWEWCCYTIGDRYGHGSDVKRDREGRYWYAAPYGLWRFDNTGGYLFTKENSSLPGKYVRRIAIDSSDKLWLSVRDKYLNGDQSWLVNLNDTGFCTIRTCDIYYGINDIEIDFNNDIWFTETGSTVGIEFGHGVFKLSGSSLENYTISNSQLSSNTVFDLSLDRNSTMWMATYGTGIDTLRITDNTWGCFTVENSHITDNNLTQIEIDAKNNKWIKSHMQGITVYRKGGIDFQTSIKPVPDNKTSIKTIMPVFIKNSKLYFKTPVQISATISVYSVSGRRIACFDKRIYAPGMHCLPFKSNNVSQSVLLVQIESGKEKYHFKVYNGSR